MAANLQKMSPSKLKALKEGETISVRYATSQQEVDNGSVRILIERFPKQVAVAFSSVWSTQLCADAPAKSGNLVPTKRTSVTVVGGWLETYRMILRWMLSCCEGKGMQQFPPAAKNPFSTFYAVREVSDSLGINVLTQQMEYHLRRMVASQIHTDDIREMYAEWPAGHPVLTDIAIHIADLLGTRTLRGYAAYKILWEELPQFDQDLRIALDQRSTLPEDGQIRSFRSLDSRQPTRVIKKKAEQAQVQTPAVPSENQKPAGTTAESSKTSIDSSAKTGQHAGGREGEQGPPIQRPNQGRRVFARRSQRGRSTYADPSSADAGVTTASLTGSKEVPASGNGNDSARKDKGDSTAAAGTSPQSQGREQSKDKGVWQRHLRTTDGTDDRNDSAATEDAQLPHNFLTIRNDQSASPQSRSMSTSTSRSTTTSSLTQASHPSSSVTNPSSNVSSTIDASRSSSITTVDKSKSESSTDPPQQNMTQTKSAYSANAKAKAKANSNQFAIFEDDTACDTAVHQPSTR